MKFFERGSFSPEQKSIPDNDNNPEKIAERGRRSRGFKEYCNWFDFQEEDLAGEKILDIGSGQGLFGKEFKERGIEGKVISLDPVESSEREREEGNETNIDVYGLAQALPFRDDTFDLVLSSHSFPFWSLGCFEQNKETLDRLADEYYNRGQQLTAEETERFLSIMSFIVKESVRVIGKQGKAVFAPFDVFVYRASLTQDFNTKELRRLFKLLTKRLK